MNKKFVAFVLIIVLCLSFFSCGKPSNLYTVYVIKDGTGAKKDTYSSETVKYNDAKQSYTFPETKDTQKLGMKDVELVLGEQTFQLQYDHTYNKSGMDYQLNHYRTNYKATGLAISASYRDDNGKLEYLHLDKSIVYPISDSPITSEAQAKETCNKFLKQYVSDIEKYEVSVKTKMRVYSEAGSHAENFDHFVSADEYVNADVNYEVNYNYYIDDVETLDEVQVTVRSDGNLDGLSFMLVGAYDKYSSIDIDQKKCDVLIEEQITAMCTVDNYQYTGSTNQKTLILCDDVLCMLVTVTPTYEEQKTNESLSVDPIQMLIPIAK